MEVLIVGGGIGGLTLALELSRRGIGCRVFESAPEIKAVGVGINLLPHAMRRATPSSACSRRSRRSRSRPREAAFFNRFGQLIYHEPLGRRAGYEWPQFSIHRGDLQTILLDAVKAAPRRGPAAPRMRTASGSSRTKEQVMLQFKDGTPADGAAADRLRRHPFRDPQAALSGRRRAALLRASTCGAG